MNISIIIPVYNVEKYIKRCIESVINQTYKGEVECIIVNDCTPDRSIDIIENILSTYRGNIQFEILHHAANQGAAKARNTALEVANGEYIIQLDSDDYFDHTMLEQMYMKACETSADIVFTDYYLTYVDHEDYVSQVLPPTKERILGELIQGKFRGTFTRSLGNKLISHSIYKSHQIKCIEGIDYNEDLLVMLSIFMVSKKIVHLPLAFYHYVKYNVNSYCTAISYKTLNDRINANIVIANFLSDYSINSCERDFAFKKISDKSYILFTTSKKLQQQYATLYKETDKYILDYIHENVNSFYWRLAYRFGLRGNLFLFNLMRGFWRLVRRSRKEPLLTEKHIQ